MAIPRAQKTSDRLKQQLLTTDIPLDELAEIFNVLTRTIVERAANSDDPSRVQASSEKIKQAGACFLKYLSEVSGLTNTKSLTIRLQPNQYLKLQKTYKNSENRGWLFISRATGRKEATEFLGRDTKQTRKLIEKKFNIQFENIASYLPPPLPPKERKSVSEMNKRQERQLIPPTIEP